MYRETSVRGAFVSGKSIKGLPSVVLTPAEILQAMPASTRALIAQRYPDPLAAEALTSRLAALVHTILQANEFMNLTADTDPARFWERHIDDALWTARLIEPPLGINPPGADWRILDVGSGGGMPGLVWAILWPAVRVALLDSRQKRTRFLAEAATSLGLANVEVHCGRAEDLGQTPALRERFDLVTARALAELATLLELTLPFARVGGHLAAIKASPVEAELATASRALRELGAGGASPIQLPYTRGDAKACVICLVRKTAPTPPAYPRPANQPERRPLKG